jgi:type II secretion system protein C
VSTQHRVNGVRTRWLALFIGLGFGAVLAPQLWPYLRVWLSSSTTVRTERPVSTPKRIITPAAPVQSDPALAAVGTDSSVSDKPLQLVLAGTQPGRTPHEGLAMLGVDVRNAQTYLAGAMLDNGAVLVEVHADHVVLERQRQRATLYVQGSTHASTGAPDPGPLLTVGGTELVPPRETRYSVDPVTDFIRAVPHYGADGTVAGFRVYPGVQRSAFRDWGLVSGDLVTALDGAPLVDSDHVTQALSALADGASLRASVRRGEQVIAVTLDGATLQKLNESRNARRAALQPPQP